MPGEEMYTVKEGWLMKRGKGWFSYLFSDELNYHWLIVFFPGKEVFPLLCLWSCSNIDNLGFKRENKKNRTVNSE